MFERVEVDELGDTVFWPTGADLDPEVMYGIAPAGRHAPVRVTVPQRA